MDAEHDDEKDQRGGDLSREMTFPLGVLRNKDAQAPITQLENNAIGLEIDPTIFSIDAVLRAAYKFTDRCHLFVQTHDTRPDRWSVVIRPKHPNVSGEHLAAEFANELIDQRLRTTLEQQFADVRTLIVAQAFAEGNLLDSSREVEDQNDDPRQIGRLRP